MGIGEKNINTNPREDVKGAGIKRLLNVAFSCGDLYL